MVINMDITEEVINWICAMIIAPIVFCTIIYIISWVFIIGIPYIGGVINWIIG